ncbi:hypothetical protein CC86DRAFT_409613 [Ophiobolus disseminans]|uniref:F-box domain-containing protein n=1 Tax=Ophiobolus disseminans TaxID=1469910 RepID=A0A6A6ZRD9_9PLEO|nr:hypothetical protein CC86DRAFT_409613 [Ophiobolus disseminans]
MASSVMALGRGFADIALQASTSVVLPDRRTLSQNLTNLEAHRPTRFTDVPVEIKEQIYEYTIGSDPYFCVSHIMPPTFIRPGNGYVQALPPMCLTSKLKYSIAVHVFIRHITICVHKFGDALDMTKWLHTVTGSDEDELLGVRKLELDYVNRRFLGGIADDIQVYKACANLQSITFKILEEDLRCGDWFYLSSMNLNLRSLTCTDFVAMLNLVELLQCLRLRHVAFKIRSSSTRWKNDEDEHLIMEVTKWLEEVFRKEQGRHISMEVSFSRHLLGPNKAKCTQGHN